jgi:phosphatidylglycerol:prolipoprotein diacylglycerol transferase
VLNDILLKMHFLPSRAVAIEILGFSIHWYGLLYLAGFLIAAWLLPILGKYRNLPLKRDDWWNLLSWAIVGVIGGGRLGYILFYEPSYYLQSPLKIFAVWEGGMSFHGGLIGVLLVLWMFCRRYRINFMKLADVIVIPVAIGLMLGRLGNFLNQELYGTITTLPWGMHFDGVEGLRHPTQLYAMLKDALIASVCFWHLKATIHARVAGKTGALFLMMYGLGRFMIECIRVPTHPPIDLGFVILMRGQALTLPMFVMGLIVWIALSRQQGIASKGRD